MIYLSIFCQSSVTMAKWKCFSRSFPCANVKCVNLATTKLCDGGAFWRALLFRSSATRACAISTPGGVLPDSRTRGGRELKKKNQIKWEKKFNDGKVGQSCRSRLLGQLSVESKFFWGKTEGKNKKQKIVFFCVCGFLARPFFSLRDLCVSCVYVCVCVSAGNLICLHQTSAIWKKLHLEKQKRNTRTKLKRCDGVVGGAFY